MPCKPYKNALIEAAAGGMELQGELRAHLVHCADCRATFEQEQAFFSSIDSSLQVSANAEVPASLLPRVRARIEELPAAKGAWGARGLVLASAAVIIVSFFTARAVWHKSPVKKPAEVAGNQSVPPRATPPLQSQIPAVVPPVERDSASQRQHPVARNHSAPEMLVRAKPVPEVLVPHDQEILLAQYVEQWRRHKGTVVLARNFDATVFLPLQVAPIQIDELDVKLLAEEKAQ